MKIESVTKSIRNTKDICYSVFCALLTHYKGNLTTFKTISKPPNAQPPTDYPLNDVQSHDCVTFFSSFSLRPSEIAIDYRILSSPDQTSNSPPHPTPFSSHPLLYCAVAGWIADCTPQS